MKDTASRMLVVSPHPDDGLLGAGGVMARFAANGGEVTVLTVSAHMPPLFDETTHRISVEEARVAYEDVGVAETVFLDMPALSVAEQHHHEVNNAIGEVFVRVAPDVLIVPYYDRHTDHRAVFDSCMVACRAYADRTSPSVVAACEILSSTHWNAPHIEPNFRPNWTVDITDFMEAKTRMLSLCPSQIKEFPHPRSLEVLRALAQFRGSQVGMAYGEAFEIIRMTTPPEILC